MVYSPSPDNNTLGKGVVWFNEVISSVYAGERDLGNCPEFNFSVDLEKLPHYSSRGGIRAKDKEVVQEISPAFNFTLDEITKENVALLSLANMTTVVQAAVGASEALIPSHGLRMLLANRAIAPNNLFFLSYTNPASQTPVVGETVSNPGTAEGVVVFVPAADTGCYIYKTVLTDDFESGEAITGDSSASFTLDANELDTGSAVVVSSADGTTIYDITDDYLVSTTLKDFDIGRVQAVIDGALPNDGTTPVTVSSYHLATTYYRIKAFTKTVIEGFLRFVSDNPTGEQLELQCWRVSMTPDGDTALIGEDWSTLAFVGEVLKDETGHPDSPFYDVIMD